MERDMEVYTYHMCINRRREKERDREIERVREGAEGDGGGPGSAAVERKAPMPRLSQMLSSSEASLHYSR